MKIYSKIILLLFLYSGSFFGQGGWKKKFYLSGGFASKSKGVIETPVGNLITIGITSDTLYSKVFNRLTLIGTDGAGNQLWRKDYGGSKFSYLSNAYAPYAAVYKDVNAFYYTVGIRDSVNKYNGVLVKFNFNGDTLWQKIIRESGEDVIPQGITKGIDGGLLITGEFQNWTNNALPCMILKTDINGNELWRKKIYKPGLDFILGNGIVQDSATKKIVITGFQSTSGSSSFNLLITDSLGNKITQSTLNNPGGGGALDLIQLKDKNFLTYGAWNEYYSSADYLSGLVTKFDINGSVIWSKRYLTPGVQNQIRFAKELDNGDIVLLGNLDSSQHNPYKNYVKTILLRISQNGKLKRYKVVGTAYESGIDESANSLNTTADGGFIISTEFQLMHNPTPYSIIKVDSTFCDTTTQWCVSVELGLDKFNLLTGYKFEMFPNPAKDVLNLSLRLAQASGALTVKIMDLSGREIESISITPNENTQLNTSNYAPGIYFINIIYEGRTVDTRKLLIER